MKHCPKCGLDKIIEEFYRRRTGREVGNYYEKCKECYRDRGRKYYHQNKDIQLGLAILRKHRYKKERGEFVNTLKKDKPCKDCNRIFPPWVMDFDHREGEIKIGSVSRLATTDTVNIDRIKIEIAKCDLVCANCHRQRTYERQHRDNAEVAKLVKAPV